VGGEPQAPPGTKPVCGKRGLEQVSPWRGPSFLETKVDVGLWGSARFWLELHGVEGIVAGAEEAVEFGDEGGGEEAVVVGGAEAAARGRRAVLATSSQ
jgi:hypothetical protein